MRVCGIAFNILNVPSRFAAILHESVAPLAERLGFFLPFFFFFYETANLEHPETPRKPGVARWFLYRIVGKAEGRHGAKDNPFEGRPRSRARTDAIA